MSTAWLRFITLRTEMEKLMENYAKRWQVVRKLDDDGTHQNFITHLQKPLFSARVVKIDPLENLPIPNEGPADIANGFVCPWDNTTVLCQIVWTVTPTPAERDHWLWTAAYNFMTFCGPFMRWARLPPVLQMAQRLNLDILDCTDWDDFTELFGDENDLSGGQLIERIRKLACLLSSGELPVLLAMLHAADYSRVADELSGDNLWRKLDQTSVDHAEAVALPIRRA